MVRILPAIVAGWLLVSLLFAPGAAVATDFRVYPLKVKLPVLMVEDGAETDRIVKRTLKESDVVNLALGRPVGTKVDKKTEVLAAMVPFFDPDVLGSIVVLDPSQNGLAQITTIVAEPVGPERDHAVLRSSVEAFGTVMGTVVETTLGDPASHGLLSTTIWVAGSGKARNDKASGKGIVGGRLSFNVTNGVTSTFSGFIVKGEVKVSGKPISILSDGVFVGCGDGIVQPELGEECEFSDLNGCLGTCAQCICRFCGNDRKDDDEICDGADSANCDALTPPRPCREDCTGCAVCGDGVISPHEECELAPLDPNDPRQLCPGERCLVLQGCVCGCDPGSAASCPAAECCDDVSPGQQGRFECCQPRFSSADPPCGLLFAGCCGGGPLDPGTFCGGLLPDQVVCPDTDCADGTSFVCHPCNGVPLTGTCDSTTGECTFDPR